LHEDRASVGLNRVALVVAQRAARGSANGLAEGQIALGLVAIDERLPPILERRRDDDGPL
jgi:hypothetical protein